MSGRFSRARGLPDRLEHGETVKLSSFGSFVVRGKGARMARNSKTGEEVPITPRRVLVFKPSAILKQRLARADEVTPQVLHASRRGGSRGKATHG